MIAPAFGRVIAVHPESHSVDVMLDNGRTLPGVPVMSQSASMDGGDSNLPDTAGGNNVVLAVICFVSDNPLCLGFIHPKGNSYAFTDNRALNLHHSGVYSTINAGGDMEVFHPSGAFVAIGESDVHADLTGLDYQGVFAVTKNTGKTISITLGFVNNAAKIKLSPNGDIAITGNISVTGGITTTGDVVADGISLDTHVHGNGNGGADTTGPK